jgi:predicted transport protein
LVWSLVISGYIGYRTLTNHVDVYFDKKKQALGWDMSVPPKEKTYALAPRDESFRFRGASRLPDSEIEL